MTRLLLIDYASPLSSLHCRSYDRIAFEDSDSPSCELFSVRLDVADAGTPHETPLRHEKCGDAEKRALSFDAWERALKEAGRG